MFHWPTYTFYNWCICRLQMEDNLGTFEDIKGPSWYEKVSKCSFYWFIGSIDKQYRTCKGIKNFESLTQSWYDKPLFAYFEFTYCEPCSIVLNIQLGIKIHTLLLESRILNSNTNLVALRTCPWPRWHICMSWPCQSSPWPCSSVLLTPLCNIE